MFKPSKTAERKIRKLEGEVLDLRSQLEAAERTIVVKQAEIENLAAVVARDRMRIQSETAAYGKARAENEGQQKT